MSIERRELYQSSNGDRWYLARDAESTRVFVQHQGNAPSGGHIEDMELAGFLADRRDAPERMAFFLLLATLFKVPGDEQSMSFDKLNASNDE